MFALGFYHAIYFELRMKNNDIKDSTRPMGLLSLILSFMALFVISGLLFFPIDNETRQVLIGLDFIICSIFLLQLTIDLIRSTDRRSFIKLHWIDFVASIPMIEPLRFARIFHILRVVLVLRSSKFILHQLKENRRETTVASILLLMVILITLGSTAMLFIEAKNPAANIRTGADALWWVFVTISTVGYGDHYPVTSGGKFLAVIIIVCGVGIFGMISGVITSILTAPTKQQDHRSKNKERMLEQLLEQQEQILERLTFIEEEMQQRKIQTKK
ncbi:potassium channel family protein [Vibrio parahaemolyticus]|uniref:potassium channel family protein n=1 Tax=Vibrio parahaemolyticus TaxID=670 RepID=UPI001E2D308F|nr:potassium channel family protein [Vibrio parahaemolyticus]MCD2149123.1 potassium channel family protein [Vibrio parahaemolyticus]HCJ4665410.1 potassium channel family protein [Vibrio parahaemolyticus]